MTRLQSILRHFALSHFPSFSQLTDWPTDNFSIILYKYSLGYFNNKFWSYEERNSSFNSESSSQFTCKISRLANHQNLSYKQFSKATQNGKLPLWTCRLRRYCALTTLWKPIYKNYAPTQTIYTGILLLTIYYYYDDGFVRQPSFRYRLRAILSLIW